MAGNDNHPGETAVPKEQPKVQDSLALEVQE